MAHSTTISIVVQWYDHSTNYLKQLKELPEWFRQILLITDRPDEIPQELTTGGDHSISCITHEEDASLVACLNEAISQATSEWILILEESELIYLPGFKELPFDKSYVFPARIQKQNDPTKRIFNEIRLFPNVSDFELKGINLRDFQPALQKHGLKVHDEIFDIIREHEFIGNIDLEQEISADPNHGPALLMKAVNQAASREYEAASENFKRAIQTGRLLSFDHAAALNGLADASYELNRWHECKQRAEQSLEITRRQRMPFLILFRTAFASNRWSEAYDHLYTYLEVLASGTRVNQDVVFPLSDTQYLLGESAYRNGWHQRALAHYEQYYDLKKGNIQSDVIERLLLYAIELAEYDKSLIYFNRLFGDLIKEPLSASDETRILEILSLFMEQGWYDFSLEVYELLCQNNPDRPELMRRWVAALIRAKKVEKAQEIISKHQTKFA